MAAPAPGPRPSFRLFPLVAGHPVLRVLLWVLLVVVIVLLLVRWVGSPVATRLANRELAALPDYTGHVDRVTLSLWRGTASVKNFSLSERENAGKNVPPVLKIRRAVMHWAPDSIFRGRLGGRVEIEGLELTVSKTERIEDVAEAAEDAGRKAAATKEKIRQWQSVLADAFPMEIASLDVTDSRARFLDTTYQPQVDVALESFALHATGLRNRRGGEEYPAHITMSGRTTGDGRLDLQIRADPLADQPRFTTRFELKQLSLPACNALLRAYADADVSRGTFEIYIEAQAQGGSYEGYVKPFFKDLEFENPSDEDKNVVEKTKEAIVSGVTKLLENDDEKVATQAPFSGNFARNDVDLWTTIGNLLRNAFVEALRGGFSGSPGAGNPTAKDPSDS